MSLSRSPRQNRLLDLETELFGQRSPVASQQAQDQVREPKISHPQSIAQSFAQSSPQFSYTQLANRLRGASTALDRSKPASVSVQFSRPITGSLPQSITQAKPNALEWFHPDRFKLAELEPVIHEQQRDEPEIIHLQTRIIQQRMIQPEGIHAVTGIVPLPIQEATHSLESQIPLQRPLLSQSIAIWQPALRIDIHALRRIMLNGFFELAALPATQSTDDDSQQNLLHDSLDQRSLHTTIGLEHAPFQCWLNYLFRLLKVINFLDMLPQRRRSVSPQLQRIQSLLVELDSGSLGDRSMSPLLTEQTSHPLLTTTQPQAEEVE